jgi:hypothetical protein
MLEVEELLDKYHDMIRGAAWKAAHAWGWDFQDLLSQGYLIFMRTVYKYDETRGASLGTLLFHELRTLNDYCAKEINRRGRALPLMEEVLDDGAKKYERDYFSRIKIRLNWDECTEMESPQFVTFCSVLERVESSTNLSQDAKEILNYILFGDWDVTGKVTKPSLNHTKTVFRVNGWMPLRTKKAWDELQNWYKTQVA